MKFKTLMAAALMPLTFLASAQRSSDPDGCLMYSLPSTVITLEVDALQEKFYAGPYAKFAEKYLGIKARQKDETTFQITGIRMTPYVEADQDARYMLDLKGGKVDASFLKLSSQGLISFGSANFGNEYVWRFPSVSEGDFSDKGVSSNLTSEATTLYRNDKKESDYSKVSVQQNMIVEKSLEKRASETADMILQLRRQRLQIVTGDTDATYSGEAMGAAIEEITRLEREYMTLFIGYTETQQQTMNFDVVPQADRENQMYVAFRLSDSAGLVPADDLSGKPVVLEISARKFAQVDKPQEEADPKAKPAKASNVVNAYYRIPAICTVRIMNGVDLLLQSRIPVYQLGQTSTFPLNITLK